MMCFLILKRPVVPICVIGIHPEGPKASCHIIPTDQSRARARTGGGALLEKPAQLNRGERNLNPKHLERREAQETHTAGTHTHIHFLTHTHFHSDTLSLGVSAGERGTSVRAERAVSGQAESVRAQFFWSKKKKKKKFLLFSLSLRRSDGKVGSARIISPVICLCEAAPRGSVQPLRAPPPRVSSSPPAVPMSAAFSPSFMVMQRPLGSTTAFSIDSLIGGPPQPSPGHFVYTGYPMFMPYRSVVLQPPPPPPPALQQALPAGHHGAHPQIPSLQSGFCSSLAQGLSQGMALTSTLMASLPGGFSPSQQHQEAARKFGSQALHAVFDKTQELRLEEDGKSFLQAKESAGLQAFHDTDTAVQASTGRRVTQEQSPQTV